MQKNSPNIQRRARRIRRKLDLIEGDLRDLIEALDHIYGTDDHDLLDTADMVLIFCEDRITDLAEHTLDIADGIPRLIYEAQEAQSV